MVSDRKTTHSCHQRDSNFTEEGIVFELPEDFNLLRMRRSTHIKHNSGSGGGFSWEVRFEGENVYVKIDMFGFDKSELPMELNLTFYAWVYGEGNVGRPLTLRRSSADSSEFVGSRPKIEGAESFWFAY